jgi:hypothetical protein
MRFFLGTLFKEALNDHAEAQKALTPLEKFLAFEGTLTESQWHTVVDALIVADDVYVKVSEVLTDADYAKQVSIGWYGGNPAAVPLSFLAQNLVTHNTHHRGQLSQILDSLKIEHNFSGLSPACLN